MIIFVTASNSLYRNVCKYNAYCATRYGKFDKIVVYDIDTMIDEDYRQQHADVLSIERGAGLWLWKVYFINKALKEECHEGDILFYADAASFFFRSVKPVVQKMRDDIFACNVPYIEEEFTKSETLKQMGLNEERFTKSRQFQASFMAFRKTPFTIKFVEEWKKYCEDFRLMSSDSYIGKQIPSFVAHRNDQSIFSLLCKKYGVQPSEDPSQFGITGYESFRGSAIMPLVPSSLSSFCIMLHRERKWGVNVKIKCWLRVYKRYGIIALRIFRII